MLLIKKRKEIILPPSLQSLNLYQLNQRMFGATLKDLGWSQAMRDELKALAENPTWELVPRTPNMNVVGCKLVFKTKRHANGSLERLKARIEAKGYTQIP